MDNEEYETCVVLGGGGHARVLIDCLVANGVSLPRAVLDENPSLWGGDLLGVPVLGGDDYLVDLAREGVESFIIGLGGTGDNSHRRGLYEYAIRLGLDPLGVVHTRSICSPSVDMGPGCQVLAGGIVSTGAVLGCNVLINSGAIVEHDCSVGDHSHVATGARLAGAVRVGAGAHIGIGATVRQGSSIGTEAIVGAGAVVVKDVAPREVVAGVPAKALDGH